MYRIKVKFQQGRKQERRSRKFPSRKAGKVLYFANWNSAWQFCVTTGLSPKQIALI